MPLDSYNRCVEPDADRSDAVVSELRGAGAVFALVFGSRARGDARSDSDLDVAAWWPVDPPNSWDIDLPAGVDLVVLKPVMSLELAGRIALDGRVLFEDDPAARVRWVADTRKIWLDERPRFETAHRTYLEAAARGR